MELFQILECSNVLGTCCSDYGLVALLNIARRFFDVLQILVPIVLIVFSAMQMVKLVINPDDKKHMKKVATNVIAAVLVFFLPVIIDTVMALLPTSESYQVAACWQTAKTYGEIIGLEESEYIDPNDGDERESILIDPSQYEPAPNNGGNNGDWIPTGADYDPSRATGSELGKKIAAYAMQFVGGKYVLEGQWDGEIPYTPTCCAGFVSGVYRHFGFKIYETWNGYWVPNIWNAKDKYTIVTDGSIMAGDLVIYGSNDHVAMLTGQGRQIVHAANSRDGVKVNSDYNYSNNVKAILRIKGVN